MEVANELMVRGIVVGVFQENCWVIGSRQTSEAICIDPGDQPDEILALARDMGVTIKLIANSHAHVDHILGVAGVHRETNAKFLLHEDDLDLLRTGWQSSAEKFGFDVNDPPPDPAAFVGPIEETRAIFDDVYRQIFTRIALLTALPIVSLDRMSLQARVDELGTLP